MATIEVMGGPHDGAVFEIDPHADYLVLPLPVPLQGVPLPPKDGLPPQSSLCFALLPIRHGRAWWAERSVRNDTP